MTKPQQCRAENEAGPQIAEPKRHEARGRLGAMLSKSRTYCYDSLFSSCVP